SVGETSSLAHLVNSRQRSTSAAFGAKRSFIPTGRIARLRTAGDCCIHPTLGGTRWAQPRRRYIFQGGSPKIGYPTSPTGRSSLPEIVSDQISGDEARMDFRFSRFLPTRGTPLGDKTRWQCFLQPSSCEMRCTVPVPIPSDLATFKIPTPF